eukprot:gene25577-20914_t
MCLVMDHVNCVKMIGVCVQQAPWLCVLECMAYGDLLGLLRGFRARKSAIEISEAIHICLDIAQMYMKLMDGMRLQMPPATPKDIWECLETCWLQEPSERMSFTGLIARIETLVKGNKKYEFKNSRDLGAVVGTIEAPDEDFEDLSPTSPSVYGDAGAGMSMVMGRRGSKHAVPKCGYSSANGKCTAVINLAGGVKYCNHHLCGNHAVDGCVNMKSSREQLCKKCQEKAGKGALGGSISASSMGFGGGIGSQVRASKMLGGSNYG